MYVVIPFCFIERFGEEGYGSVFLPLILLSEDGTSGVS